MAGTPLPPAEDVIILHVTRRRNTLGVLMANRGGDVLSELREKLKEAGLDVELPDLTGIDPDCKVICMPVGLSATLREMDREPRSNVVMVRVDDETLRRLDSWIETGAVGSRSEAAALFLREGLAVRAEELRELEDALNDVERAKERLRQKARTVLHPDPPDEAADDTKAT